MVAILVLAAIWWSGAWSTTGQRVEEYAQLRQLAGAHDVLGSLAGWWSAFASDPVRLEAVGLTAQVACIAAAIAAAWVIGGSLTLAGAAGIVLLTSPFPAAWLGRPLGPADALTVLAGIVLVATAIRDDERFWPLEVAAAGVAVLVAGWPFAAVLPLALAVRGRRAAAPVAAAVVALAARAALGVRPADLAGPWDPAAPHAVDTLRALLAILVVVPAAAYLATRPGAGARLAGARDALGRPGSAAAGAAVVLALAAGLLAGGAHGAALFVAEVAVVLIAVAVLASAGSAPAFRVASALAGAVVLIGAVHRAGGPPPDDAARVARDKTIVRGAAAAPSFVLVEDPYAPYAANYAPAVLAYYAGRAVHPVYAAAVPERIDGPVLFATPDGLNRIDGTVRALRELDAARRLPIFDLQAHAAAGRIAGAQPDAGPGGHSVMPSYQLGAVGGDITAITVVSGYAYTFDRVPVMPGSRLVYAEAKVFSVGGDARATVRVEVPGQPAIVAQDDLPPGPVAGPRAWRFRAVPIPVARPAFARVTFETSSPSGDATGNWVGFAQPAIVR
ncbi:MAG TPA: hypothetical protein VHT53_13270 [Candidatus Elarobacter sp.]|nr:hypothetical protein [Candidatus Elarobacter sp.]